MAFMGPDAPAGLRPRAADGRRLLAAPWVHDARRLRDGRARHATRGWHVVADPGDPRRHRRAGRQVALRRLAEPARPGRCDARGAAGVRCLAARPRDRGRSGLRLDQSPTSGRRPSPEADAAALHCRPARGRARPHALRLSRPASHSRATAGAVLDVWLAARRGLPDTQPAASRAPRAHAARGQGIRGEPAHPSGGGNDQAGRRRPLHACALLPGDHAELPARLRDAVVAAAGDADGRPARGAVARDHPQEPRCDASDRRSRPRRARQRRVGQAVLRSVRRAGAVSQARARARREDAALSPDGLRRGPR